MAQRVVDAALAAVIRLSPMVVFSEFLKYCFVLFNINIALCGVVRIVKKNEI